MRFLVYCYLFFSFTFIWALAPSTQTHSAFTIPEAIALLRKQIPPKEDWLKPEAWIQRGFTFEKELTDNITHKFVRYPIWKRGPYRIKISRTDFYTNLEQLIDNDAISVVPIIAQGMLYGTSYYIEIWLEDFGFMNINEWLKTLPESPESKIQQMIFYYQYLSAMKSLFDHDIYHGHPFFKNVQYNPMTQTVYLIDLKLIKFLNRLVSQNWNIIYRDLRFALYQSQNIIPELDVLLKTSRNYDDALKKLFEYFLKMIFKNQNGKNAILWINNNGVLVKKTVQVKKVRKGPLQTSHIPLFERSKYYEHMYLVTNGGDIDFENIFHMQFDSSFSMPENKHLKPLLELLNQILKSQQNHNLINDYNLLNTAA